MRPLILMISLLLITVFSFTVIARAAESLTTSQIIDLAIKQNPELKAIELEAKSLSERASFGSLWDDPVLELGVERSNQPINPPTGDTDFGRVSVSQMIPRSGRLKAREESFRAQFNIGNLERELSRIEMTGRILKSIYAYKIANERWEHSKERVARIKTVDTFIRGRPFVAPQRQAEAVITRSKLAILEKQFRQFEAERAGAWNELNVYLGLQSEPVLKVNWIKKSAVFSKDDLIARAETTNPEVRRQLLKVTNQQSQLQVAKMEAWPGLTLTGAYSDGIGANPQKNYGLGVSFPIPVLNGNRAAIKGTEALVTAEEARLQWARIRLRAAVDSAVQKFNAAAQSIKLLPVEEIGANEKSMPRIDSAFKKGQVELITYLEADAQHFENFNQALESQMEYLSSLSELLYLVGEVPQLTEN
jgi:cobalt-zinc-cadmium efflux system outer membrane protein